jgi:hypothetical protein
MQPEETCSVYVELAATGGLKLPLGSASIPVCDWAKFLGSDTKVVFLSLMTPKMDRDELYRCTLESVTLCHGYHSRTNATPSKQHSTQPE